MGRVGPQSAAQSECAPLPLLCRTSTSLGACGWSTGCLVLSSVRGLQMNVCWINEARRLVERSHECTRRSDQTISMHTRRSYRVWMGLSPSIELNHANGKSVHALRKAPTDSHQPRVSQKIELTAGLSVRKRAQARSQSAQKLEVRRLGGASASCSRARPVEGGRPASALGPIGAKSRLF